MLTDLFIGLEAAHVRYVLIGGMAVNLHGVPRSTFDIDLAVSFDEDNLRRFWEYMLSVGFKPRQPVTLQQFLQPAMREDWRVHKHMLAITFVVESPFWLEVDVLLDLAGMTFEELQADSCRIPMKDISIPVAGIDSLIHMKLAAGREQDLCDVEVLRRLQ